MATDMELFLSLLSLLLLLVLTVLAYAIYCGLFHTIQIDACKPPFESLIIAYKFSRGPFKNSSQLFTEVHSIVPHLQCIGVFYDNPKEVSPENLRYLVGVIVGDKATTASSDDQVLLQQKGYNFATFPSVDHVVITTFPFKSRLSIIIAVARVYPVLCSYIEEKRLCAHPMIEIYRESDILFVAPLSKQNEFYVKEVMSEIGEEASLSQDDSSNEEKEETSRSTAELASVPAEDDLPTAEGNGVNGNGSDKSSASSFEELTLLDK